MEIVCLVENQKEDSHLESEHGLSLFIDNGHEKILFDTGATDKLVGNASKMGVELEEVDLVVISHGHRDHGGGLKSFFKINRDAPVYMGQGADRKHLRVDAGSSKDIGLDKDILEEYAHRIRFLEGSTRLNENLCILTSIPHTHDVPEGNQLLYEEHDSKLVPDSFRHELIMILEKEGGLLVFTGCSHSGILNILDAVVEYFPDTPILAVFGGLHLMIPPDDSMVNSAEVEMIARKLLEYHIGKIYTGHCTGTQAYHVLKKIMGDGIEYFDTGSKAVL